MSKNNSNFCFFDTTIRVQLLIKKYPIDRLIGSIKLDLK